MMHDLRFAVRQLWKAPGFTIAAGVRALLRRNFGAVTVLLSTRQQRPEIAYVLADCGARLLIHEATLADRLPDARDVPGLMHRIAIDDARLDPIWAKCGALGIPVLIHSGEPNSFWNPKNKYNERWLELKQEPSRYRSPDHYPSFDSIMSEQHHVFRKHPETKFIDAHLGWYGNDLEKLGKLFDELPNVYTELGAVLAELGRQPRFARQWMIKYQDRVMMGKDTYKKEEYYTYFRVLETDDEYFDYYRKRHAHWKMYGLALPDSVLQKIYYKNALSVIPGIDRSLFNEK